MRQKLVLEASDCALIMAAAKEKAREKGWAVTIAIVDEAGIPLHLERLDGAIPMSASVAVEKARSAAVTRRTTKAAEDMVKDRPGTAALPRITVQGGLPIIVKGECVGAVGCSGVQSHEDEEIVAAGIAALGL
ncbi:hypothetical protein HDIA_1525 [Hartmannibacter diazotrophicus]|uniref:GlcG protein n=1 Tax=Hartmannibacter diazotrophicus TaxID=1482074 RepID=A0A2C9D460_9HYPH|nr:heme-binding protein [Hartmannibacter diazotrophicus]SON55066.1 hypothetical protein HDIA_1525 [Hartmannibacter diazotrophicus]